MLDDAYYSLFLQGIRTVDALSVLGTEYIVPFKAKAYLDLKARREAGENVDSRKVKKHKRDALRLAQLLGESEGVDLRGELKDDMLAFVKDCEVGDVNLKRIGVAGVTMAQFARDDESNIWLDWLSGVTWPGRCSQAALSGVEAR